MGAVDTHEIQIRLYDLLTYFSDFCVRENLKYFLSNGTLLGAAKYGGFIPWDDDIDIIMPREDYDKLVASQTVDTDSYKLFCREKLPNWKMPYAKLIDSKTVLQEEGFDCGEEIGIFIDIFPIDKWHHNKIIAKCQAFSGEIRKRLIVNSIAGSFNTQKKGLKKAILFTLYFVGQKMGNQKLNKCVEGKVKKSRKYKSGYLGCLVWTCHCFAEVLPADVFASSVFLPFQGGEFPAPIGYEPYLDSLYGNWRDDLPTEKQRSNHNIKVWYKHEV